MGTALWFKFEINMYDDSKFKIIDKMNERYLINYVWPRLLVLAGKTNDCGYMYINENMPHTVKTLAIEFNISLDEMKLALKVLKKLQMIELTDEKFLKIKNWDKHQNIEGMERIKKLNCDRVAKHRAKKKLESKASTDIKSEATFNINKSSTEIENNTCNDLCNDSNKSYNITGDINKIACNVTVTEQNKNKDKDKNLDREEKKNKKNSSNILNHDNAFSHIKIDKIKTDDKYNIQSTNDNYPILENNDSNNLQPSNGLNNKDNDFLTVEATDISNYFEKLTGKPGILNIGTLKIAISKHGKDNVIKAIEKSLEVDIYNMSYINGILDNWCKDGYPSAKTNNKENIVKGVINNDNISTKRNTKENKNQFSGFKPKEPKRLTDEQRRKLEKELI